jgi:hypothetical protein
MPLLTSRPPHIPKALISRLGALTPADGADPDGNGAAEVTGLALSALHDAEEAADDARAAAVLRALAAGLSGGGPAATVLDAAAFDWAPPALRAGGEGPCSLSAAHALAAALASALSAKEAVALLSGEVAGGSGGGGGRHVWTAPQAAALAALPVALGRASDKQRARLLASALEAVRVGLGPTLRRGVVAGGGGDAEVSCPLAAADAWWAALPGWTVLGITDSPITGPEGNREFLIGSRRLP